MLRPLLVFSAPVLLAAALWRADEAPAAVSRPFVQVTPADHAPILAKIDAQPWAKSPPAVKARTDLGEPADD